MRAENKINLNKLILILLSLGLLEIVIYGLHVWGWGLSDQESQSMEPGWYLTYPVFFNHKIKTGDIVLFNPDKTTEQLMLARGWIGPNTPMMKYVRAESGDVVCIHDQALWMNQVLVGEIKQQDSLGRPLPQISFCRKLKEGEFFMVSTRRPNSFDSRYFGVVKLNQILARAVAL